MRILVVEDEDRIAGFLKKGLEEESYAVDIAPDGISALEWVAGAQYDLILLDVMLPGLSGFEVCQVLRQRRVDSPILMLTARDDIDDRVQGLDFGADDYLTKPFAFKELLARIRALTRRTASNPTSDVTLEFADLQLDTVTHKAKRGHREIDLTPKEYALLEFFLRHPRRPLSRTMVRENIWGYDYFGASNVVDVYVRHLRQKLESGGEPALIHTVRGVGYQLDDPE
ncbi:MAG: response regulator transcription factor [Anaerolineae bacterium]|nr:response regulator transcription factor [Anaerolineae bacterium]MCB0179331.1 response regulator transcription factor [Anaerolineae bacterium]MCB9107029.1 response regulator transcription factor [Anaerolineales bacterium]